MVSCIYVIWRICEDIWVEGQGEWTVGNQEQACPGGGFSMNMYTLEFKVVYTASGCTDIDE